MIGLNILKKVVVSILADLHSGFSTTNSLLTHIYVIEFCLINNLKVIMGVDIPRLNIARIANGVQVTL